MGDNNKDITILKVSLWYLRFHQMWPKKNEIFNLGKEFYIRAIFTLMSSAWMLLAALSHLFISLRDHIHVDLSENIGMGLSLFGVHYLSIVYAGSVKNLIKLYLKLSDCSEFGEPPTLKKISKKYDFYSKLYYYYCTFGIAVYGLCNCYLEKDDCERINKERDLNELCLVFTTTYMPFDVNYFPAKQILLVLEFYAGEMILRSGAAVLFTSLECLQVVTTKFVHLEELFVQVFKTKNRKLQRKLFNHCVRYHNDIIRQAVMVSNTYTILNFMHVLITGIILGSIGHHVKTHFTPGAVIHLTAWVMGLYVVCLGGEVLYNASLSVSTSVYNTLWYEAPLDIQKDLLLVMQRSQRPLYLKAGPIGFLKFDLFVTIIKTSYSYLTLLNNL